MNREDSATQGLAYVNGAGNAILRVDNFSTVPYNEKRNSVRITSTDLYDYGSLWIIDILHLPFGCSVRIILRIPNYTVSEGKYNKIGVAGVLD